MEAKSYEKYRWFFTSSGKLVVGGKSARQNEELVKLAEETNVIMHTASPGSPFCIIKNPNTLDMEETAIFTACFSQEWKKLKKRTEVHIFKGSQAVKKDRMKQGTFGIAGKIFKKNVELKLALDFQEGKLRALPPSAAKKKLAVLTPGDLNKEEAAGKIIKIIRNKCGYSPSKEEIMSAIPSDRIGVREK